MWRLWKKKAKCGEWFKQISADLLLIGLISYPKPAYLKGCFAGMVERQDKGFFFGGMLCTRKTRLKKLSVMITL
ncbi:MAG: hypothetical protein LBB22_04005 [Treponema sp.]|jgi:hypothetical protein|nr:hypothetical protein [Treponema sp.]